MPAPRSTWLGLPAVLIAGLAVAQPASAAAPTAKITNKVLQITGDATAQRITLRNLASDHTRLLIDVGDDGTADFNFSRTAFTTIQAGLGGGNDSLRIDDANGGVTATRPATVDGGSGNDSFRGGAGAETFLGGDGNDVAIGDGGNDVLLLGAGDDEARWAPGDGNDTVEGQDGQDRLTASGSTAGERYEVAANGPRIRLTRDISKVVLDADGIERIAIHSSRGADTLTVHDLSGTGLDELDTDLGAGDAAADGVIVEGTDGDDSAVVAGSGGALAVSGLHTIVTIGGAEPSNDALTVHTLAGDDVIEAGSLAATVIRLTADAGDGADILFGSDGADTLLGAAGDDVLLGGPGQDVLDGGAGDNIVIQ